MLIVNDSRIALKANTSAVGVAVVPVVAIVVDFLCWSVAILSTGDVCTDKPNKLLHLDYIPICIVCLLCACMCVCVTLCVCMCVCVCVCVCTCVHIWKTYVQNNTLSFVTISEISFGLEISNDGSDIVHNRLDIFITIWHLHTINAYSEVQ